MTNMRMTDQDLSTRETKIETRGVHVFYGDNEAINGVDVDILDKTVTAFIGPSGCGKSTFLRCLNRMNDTIPICRVTGDIKIDGGDIYDKSIDPVQLRAKVGMVFQKPNPFPKSIYDNVAYGPRIHGLAKNKAELDDIVEKALRGGALWDEVKDRLHAPGTGLGRIAAMVQKELEHILVPLEGDLTFGKQRLAGLFELKFGDTTDLLPI